MPYASQTEMEELAGGAERFLELTDWDNNGTVDAGRVISVQEEVDGWIDGFANLLYDTPIANPNQTLVKLAAAECVYRLKERRGRVTDHDEKKHEERLEWLKLLNAGKVRPSDPAPARSDAVRAEVVENASDHSRAALKGGYT